MDNKKIAVVGVGSMGTYAGVTAIEMAASYMAAKGAGVVVVAAPDGTDLKTLEEQIEALTPKPIISDEIFELQKMIPDRDYDYFEKPDNKPFCHCIADKNN